MTTNDDIRRLKRIRKTDHEDPRLSKSGANVESTICISNLEDVRKIRDWIRFDAQIRCPFSDRVVSDQSEQIVVSSTRRSWVSNPPDVSNYRTDVHATRGWISYYHTPRVSWRHICSLRIHDSRADKTSLLNILLRVHSVYLRNTRRIMYRRLRLV